MPSSSVSASRYRLDELDRIRWVGGAWSDFARANGAPELAEADILGRRVWTFVAGIETRHLYELMFEAVRRGRGAVVVPFRCDAPQLRRFMELEIRSLPGAALELTASLLREEARAPEPLLDARAPRTSEVLSICSVCKRLRVAHDRWLAVEDAVRVLDLFGRVELPGLSHGVCPDCASLMRASAKRPP
jgi:hypothetical protein